MPSTVSDYIGRTVDLVFLHGIPETGEALLIEALAPPEFPGGQVVTGIQKLVQKFLLLLFTELGSMSLRPDYGTTFMILARRGFLRTTLDVDQAFSQAEVDIRLQIRSEESAEDPTDERYGSAALKGVTVDVNSGFIGIRVLLTSLAGTGITFIFPLPIAVIR